MTQEDKNILKRINDYANEVMPDIDPQKTQVSKQLSVQMPKLQEIADELGISLEDMFIKYMDLASEMAVKREQELQNSMDMFENNNKIQF